MIRKSVQRSDCGIICGTIAAFALWYWGRRRMMSEQLVRKDTSMQRSGFDIIWGIFGIYFEGVLRKTMNDWWTIIRNWKACAMMGLWPDLECHQEISPEILTKMTIKEYSILTFPVSISLSYLQKSIKIWIRLLACPSTPKTAVTVQRILLN
jgi:hypothetical protein